MRKAIALSFLLMAIYLNRSYAYFYDQIGKVNLQPPPHSGDIVLGKAEKTLRYVALGDSLTAGVGANDYKDSYPFQLAQSFTEGQQVELINLSQPGATSGGVLSNQLPQALIEHPNVVTILVGVNDIHNLVSASKFRSNLGATVNQLQQNTSSRVYLFLIPYLGSDKVLFPPYNLLLRFRVDQFNSIIRDIANKKKVQVIDLTLQQVLYSEDNFHPSDDGYLIWSRTINADINP